MKREPVVYAVLLVAALAAAFGSWTYGGQMETLTGDIPLWKGRPEAVDSFEYVEPGQSLMARQRGTRQAPYIWATEDTSSFRMDAGTGQRLLKTVASPRAQRDLGVPDARAMRAFGLDTAHTRLVVYFHDGVRELLLGGRTFDRTGNRYVLERRSGRAYILSSLALPPLADAAVLLVEHRLHTFEPDSVGAVTIRAGGRTLTMHRLKSETTVAGAVRPVWVPASGAGQPDTAFTSFMLKLNATAAASYAARQDPRTMTLVLRADYTDRRGQPLGFLELLQRPGPDNKPEYYARSEVSGVPVYLYPGVARELLADAARQL